MLRVLCCTVHRGEAHYLEAVANIFIASHSQLSEVQLRIGTGQLVAARSFSCLYTSLIGFVQE